MTSYLNDREFTDLVHRNVALPKIYTPLGWTEVHRDLSEAEQADIEIGIDYVFQSSNRVYSVQERFREKKYSNYSDFTIRYRRDNNRHEARRDSEFFKIQADFFVYGITNCNKTAAVHCTDFLKFAVIDMKGVYRKVESGDLIIRDNGKATCEEVKGKLVCPIKYNRDHSSSFIPIDIPMLVRLWGSEVILKEHNFL